jgi:arylsulfatase A-like enzyme
MRRCSALLAALAAVLPPVTSLVAATAPDTVPPAPRPNVVFILADDLGQRDLGVYGSTFHETPQLDQLAAQGMRFDQAYAACSVCSPTRASLLTGRYPARVGITDWLPGRASKPDERLRAPALPESLAPDTVTFAHAFRAAGYRTAFIGKWHLGDAPEHLPDRFGFDLNIGGSGRGSPPSFFSPYRLPHLPDGPPGEHLDDRLTREAVDFIGRAVAEKKPFLVYLSHYAVHNPLQAKPELREKFAAKLAAQKSAEPEFATGGPDGRVRIRQTHPTYAAMVANLDASVGTLRAALEKLGVADNTIVIFTSDNGGLSTSEGHPTANTPLRTGKGWPYEGGVREPFLVAWPGRVPAGRVTEQVITSPDLFPTLLELAGLPADSTGPVDGISFASVLLGRTAALPERPLFWHYPHYSNQRGRPNSAVRLGRWKLVEWLEDNRVELFDVSTDLSEQHDVAAAQPEVVADLRRRLQAWRESVGAKMPTPNPGYQPKS